MAALKGIKWFIALCIGIALCTLLFANGYGWYVRSSSAVAFPAPGVIIELGTHSAHLNCTGEGSPMVMLISGLTDYSATWAAVQEPVSSFTRVCSYDRAGLGWSSSRSTPADMDALISDLDALIRHENNDSDVLIVGHSLGGGIAWLYTHKYLNKVVGLVSVDAIPGDPNTILPENKVGLEDAIEALELLDLLGIDALLTRLSRRADKESLDTTQLPDWAKELMLDPGFTSQQWQGLIAELKLVSGEDFSTAEDIMRPIGDLPLVVLRYGRSRALEDVITVDEGHSELLENWWQDGQEQFLSLSTDSKMVVAELSGHEIQKEQPELVVAAIVEVLEKYHAH